MKYILTLYTYEPSLISSEAIRNLKKMIVLLQPGSVDYQVVDLRKNPQIAMDNSILATPMLVRESPLPKIQIIGDLSDQRQVIMNLGLENLVVSKSAVEENGKNKSPR